MITRRAQQVGRLWVMPAPGRAKMGHRLRMTPGACPFSKNPLRGYILVQYEAEQKVLEVTALHEYASWVCGGKAGAPMSVEDIALRVRQDCEEALAVPVRVVLVAWVNPGEQRISVEL